MEIYTIGFTKHTAESFFEKLRGAQITRLVDVRLNNVSQLAGFAKRDDLRYFLQQICGAEYVHQPLLAPTKDLLDEYKKHNGRWSDYETRFLSLMEERRIEDRVPRELFAGRPVLLCSEHTPEHCHRRLVVEYLKRHWDGIDVIHL